MRNPAGSFQQKVVNLAPAESYEGSSCVLQNLESAQGAYNFSVTPSARNPEHGKENTSVEYQKKNFTEIGMRNMN